MTDSFIPRLSPEDSNPASDLKTDVIRDVEREHTITGDFVGPRSEDMPDDDGDAEGTEDGEESR